MTALSVREWLIDGASGARTSLDVIATVCERFRAAGVPIDRAEAYVRTLHPQFAGRGFVWTQATGCKADELSHGADLGTASNAVRRVFELGASQPLRFGPDEDAELTTLGLTDVVAIPLAFTTGEIHACTFATSRVGGFTEAEVAAIAGVTAPLARMAEILALRRTASNVLDAYVGRDAGARVLAGKIRRGDTELIEAAIWFSDMRGFSTMSSQRSPRDVIDLLNELFDCQVPAIERHGGEVLKFMGDGLLAIFKPVDDSLAACCGRALAASRDAIAAVAARNATGVSPLRFGVALHVGELAYGNIGSGNRLDFTCIGRAVNLAARLESLTATLGREMLASDAFAAACGGFERIGEYPVKGFAEPVAAFTPVVTPRV